MAGVILTLTLYLTNVILIVFAQSLTGECEIGRRYATRHCSRIYLLCKPGYFVSVKECPRYHVFDPEKQLCVTEKAGCQHSDPLSYTTSDTGPEVGTVLLDDIIYKSNRQNAHVSSSDAISTSDKVEAVNSAMKRPFDKTEGLEPEMENTMVAERGPVQIEPVLTDDWPDVGISSVIGHTRPLPVASRPLWPVGNVVGLGYRYPMSYSQPFLPPFLQPPIVDGFNVRIPPRPISILAFMPPRATVLDDFNVF